MNNNELVVEHPRNFSARTEVLGGTYFKIAETEYCECLRIEQINDEELSEEEKSILDGKATQAAIKAIRAGGDQTILNFMLKERNINVKILPQCFNLQDL
ncbi:hypothetical protein LCGC14_1700580, partial [marine sediment metagenome]